MNSLTVVDLESLDADRRVLANEPIDNTGVIPAVSQGNLNLSNRNWVEGIDRIPVGSGVRRQLFIGTRSQRGCQSEQKYELV